MQGITVTLMNRVKTGVDEFNHDVYAYVETRVNDVLVYPTTASDLPTDETLEGRKYVYTLGIPKGDKHDWLNCRVRFFGRTFQSFGYPVEGIEANVPTRWHKKVTVELYEP